MQPFVSVIVPIYNVEKYIEKCARSLFEQTLDNIEFIFISDCSPDNSINIIEKILCDYPPRKYQTKILSLTSNIGVAGVRNKGILESTGEYIIHCDGDDWVDNDYYERLYKKAKITDADIVIGDEVRETDSGTYPVLLPELPTKGKIIIKDFYKNTIGLFFHNKLVKRELYFNNSVFPWIGLDMWEDNGLFARLFYYAKKVEQVRGPVYHYNRTNDLAITSGYGLKQINQMLEIAKNLTDFFESQDDAEEFAKTAHAFQFLSKLNLITDSFKNYQKYKLIFPESNKIIKELDSNAFSAKGKLRFKMVKYGFAPLFIILFKIKKLIKL